MDGSSKFLIFALIVIFWQNSTYQVSDVVGAIQPDSRWQVEWQDKRERKRVLSRLNGSIEGGQVELNIVRSSILILSLRMVVCSVIMITSVLLPFLPRYIFLGHEDQIQVAVVALCKDLHMNNTLDLLTSIVDSSLELD